MLIRRTMRGKARNSIECALLLGTVLSTPKRGTWYALLVTNLGLLGEARESVPFQLLLSCCIVSRTELRGLSSLLELVWMM